MSSGPELEAEPEAKPETEPEPEQPPPAFRQLEVASAEQDVQAVLGLLRDAPSSQLRPGAALDGLWKTWAAWAASDADAIVTQKDQVEPDVPSRLTAVTRLVQWCLSSKDVVGKLPEALCATVGLLHELLPVLEEAALVPKLADELALLCLKWYQLKLRDYEHRIRNAFHYALKKCIGDKAVKQDVKRLWNFHEVLPKCWQNGDGSERLHELLLKCARSTLFLQCSEGIRFLVLVFLLDETFVEALHNSVKEVLPDLSRHLALTYGQLYHKAWRQSEANLTDILETKCLQDLMYHAVLANRDVKKSIFPNLLTFFSALHSAKNDRPCQAMLKRLWEPILWRYLKAANPVVRQSATELFLSAFPVEDPDENFEQRSADIERQYRLMLDLLHDEQPTVRIAAIQGVCQVLKHLWPVIPSNTVNELVKALVVELSCDSSSAKVRVASIKGLAVVLGNPRTHLYMAKVLPRISDSLHDVNEAVRGAVVDLLVLVKGMKAIRYWDICPLDHLLARMEVDRKGLSQKIGKLLSNSFFPRNVDEASRVERAIYLVKKSRAAARKFYDYCRAQMGLPETVKFLLAVLIHVKRFVKTKAALQEESSASLNATADADESLAQESSSASDKENCQLSYSSKPKRRKLHTNSSDLMAFEPDQQQHRGNRKPLSDSTLNQSNAMTDDSAASTSSSVLADPSLEDPDVVCGLIDIVCIFWVGIAQDLLLPENQEYRSLLEKKATKIMSVLYKYYRGNRDVIGPIVYLCSFLPHSALSHIAGFCLSRLKLETEYYQSLELHLEDLGGNGLLSTYLNSLCNWGRGDDILDVVTRWIKQNQQCLLEEKPVSTRKKTRGVRFVVAEEPPKPRLALIIAQYLLKHPFYRPMLIGKKRAHLAELHNALKDYLPQIAKHCADADLHSSPNQEHCAIDEAQNELYCTAFEVGLKLSVLCGATVEDSTSDIESMFEWAEKHLLKIDDLACLFRNRLLSSLLQISCNMLASGKCDLDFVGNSVEFCGKVLNVTGGETSVLDLCLCLLQEASSWSLVSLSCEDRITVSTRVLPDLVGRILDALFRRLEQEDPEDPATSCPTELYSSLREKSIVVLDQYRRFFIKEDEDSFYNTLDLFTTTWLKCIGRQIEKTGVVEVYSTTLEFPGFPAALFTILCSQRAYLNASFETLSSSLEIGQGFHVTGAGLAAVVAGLKLVSGPAKTRISRALVADLVLQLEKRLETEDGSELHTYAKETLEVIKRENSLTS